ncbi:MAG: hypothetical protein ABJD68_02475 [Nakamurella sp.]
MTAPRVVDLHDASSLVAADSAALLPSCALAGAQVRSVAEQLAGWPIFERPRALVVIGAAAAVDTALLNALIGANASCPVVAAPVLPGWVGALDIVVVFAAAVDDMTAARAAAGALRRGARVVVRSAAVGPVAEAAGPALLEPLISVPEALAGAARLTVLASVAASAGLYPRPDFAAAAEQLDAMAVACHPSAEFFVNPGLTLAEQLAVGTPLLIGTDAVADALAAHASRSLAGLAGIAGAWLSCGQAVGSPPVLARAAGRDGGGSAVGSDIFWDPYDDDDTAPGQQISPVLVVGPSTDSVVGRLTNSGLVQEVDQVFGAAQPAIRSPLAAALAAALPRAMCIGPDELPSPDREQSAAELGRSGAGLRQRDAFTWTVAMLCRIDFAAVYVGLLSAARPPVDSPDGLGRTGRSAAHRPAEGDRGPSARSRADNEGESGSWS